MPYIDLYVMVVLKNEEMETLDEEFHDSVENVNDIIAEVMEYPCTRSWKDQLRRQKSCGVVLGKQECW